MSVADSNSYGPIHPTFMTIEERIAMSRERILKDKKALMDKPYITSLHIETPEQCYRVRENGSFKTWKTDPYRFRLPVIHGLGPSGGSITEDGANYTYFGIYGARWHFEEDCTRR